MKKTKEEEYALLDQHAKEGGEIKSFCQRVGIKEWQFHYWRNRRKQEMQETKKESKGFVKVSVKALPTIQLRLPSGLELECKGEDIRYIAKLLHELDMIYA